MFEQEFVSFGPLFGRVDEGGHCCWAYVIAASNSGAKATNMLMDEIQNDK
jgi:hypothetical protein